MRLLVDIIIPKDAKRAPIMLTRTPYNASSYANFKTYGHPSKYLVQDGYILAFQDVRGRYMSEGKWQEMTPLEKTQRVAGEDLETALDTVAPLAEEVMMKSMSPERTARPGAWRCRWSSSRRSAPPGRRPTTARGRRRRFRGQVGRGLTRFEMRL